MAAAAPRGKPGAGGAGAAAKAGVPWSERHRPRHLGEVIGNTDQVRRLAAWLRDWDDVVLRGKVKEPPQPDPSRPQRFTPAPENLNARAALISGPPGIGKTTTCTLVARCNPTYRLMEFNASDARGKAIIESMNSSLAGNHTLRFGAAAAATAKSNSAIERAVIVMDECDGMSGGDKGGMQALINMIKTTKNPIICICNDRNDQQVRNLAGVCYDIRFRRPENAAVARRVKNILEGEGKRVDTNAVEAIVDACGQDIRHIINQAQFFGSVAMRGRESQKDTQVMLSPFDACAKLLATRAGPKLQPLERRMDLFYLDSDLMPLMVQENYIRTFEKRRRKDGDDDLAECAKAAELIALGDTLAGNWEVQSSAAVLSTIYPACVVADESFTRASFPSWLQKRSSMTKAERIATEVHGRVRGTTSTSCKELVTSNYHDMLYRRLLKPLLYGAAKECATALHSCGLTREFFTEQAPALRQPLLLDDGFKKVEGRTKSSLYQELTLLAQKSEPVKRKFEERGGGARKRARGAVEAEGIDIEAPDEGEDGADGADGAPAKRRKSGAKKEKGGSASAAGSLASWRPKPKAPEPGADGDKAAGEDSTGQKKPLMIMKYLDGHTCAVRRRVHMRDILEPWVLF